MKNCVKNLHRIKQPCIAANIESVIAEIEEQQQNNNEGGPMPAMPFYFKDDWFEEMAEKSDMLHSRCFLFGDLPAVPSNKQLQKVLEENNLPNDGSRAILLECVNDHNKQKQIHNYADYWK